jgi:hypothetical protein
MTKNERFGLVFVKTGYINSGTAVHRSTNKLWRSNSIFNLWFLLSDKRYFFCSHWPGEADGREAVRRDSHLRDMEDDEVQQPRDPRQDGAGDGHQAGEGKAAYRAAYIAAYSAAWNVRGEAAYRAAWNVWRR